MFKSTIDSLSLSKHKLLSILYEKGKIDDAKNDYGFRDFGFDELSKYMDSDSVHSVTKILIDSKDVEVTVNKSTITAYGVGSYVHKKYLKEYRKSIFEYIKNLLQIAIFATTIIFLVVDRFIEKPRIDKIEKAVIKLESENSILKQLVKSKFDEYANRKHYCDSTVRYYNEAQKR